MANYKHIHICRVLYTLHVSLLDEKLAIFLLKDNMITLLFYYVILQLFAIKFTTKIMYK